jgi:serine/threonine-protein kinase RIO1
MLFAVFACNGEDFAQLKTAKELGVKVPESILLRADKIVR